MSNFYKQFNSNQEGSAGLAQHPDNSAGFTLIELLIAISLFMFLSTGIIGIYVAFSRNQAHVKAAQQLLNDSQYAMEIIAREARNDLLLDYDISSSDCATLLASSDYQNCIVLKRDSGQVIAFARNITDSSLSYFVLTCTNDNVFSTCTATGYDTSTFLLSPTLNKIKADELTFFISPTANPFELGGPNEQPRITIKLKTSYDSTVPVERVSHILQTTVSSRIYRR